MKLFTLSLGLAILVVACGATEPARSPEVGILCPEDQPDCLEDTNLIVDPPPPANGADSSGMIAEEGLSVGEALASGLDGIIAVRGFLIMNEDEARLCDLVLESLPPQCGNPSVALEGFDPSLEETKTQAGITWTDFPVIIFGEMENGILVVDPLTKG